MNTKEIVKALNKYRPDQAAVIHQMAGERGLDPTSLTPRQYKDLIIEEAVFSVKAAAPEDLAVEKRYAAKLKSIAARI